MKPMINPRERGEGPAEHGRQPEERPRRTCWATATTSCGTPSSRATSPWSCSGPTCRRRATTPRSRRLPGRSASAACRAGEVGGKVVHRSMMPVGRVVAVAADSKNKDAAYWVAKHISYDRSLEDVSTSLTGLDPYRTTTSGIPRPTRCSRPSARAQDYLKGVEAAMADGYPEIFIPGAAQYEDSLDLHVNKVLAGTGERRSRPWTPWPRNGTRSPTSSGAPSRSSCGARPCRLQRTGVGAVKVALRSGTPRGQARRRLTLPQGVRVDLNRVSEESRADPCGHEDAKPRFLQRLEQGGAWTPILFVLPAVVTLLAITVFPLIYELRLAFMSWELTTSSPARFVGLANFGQILFHDSRFWSSMRVTACTLMVFGVGVELVLGIVLALLLNRLRRSRNLLSVPVPDPGDDRAGGGRLSIPDDLPRPVRAAELPDPAGQFRALAGLRLDRRSQDRPHRHHDDRHLAVDPVPDAHRPGRPAVYLGGAVRSGARSTALPPGRPFGASPCRCSCRSSSSAS